ncbi:MAG: phage recombination protein Bet, partial [Methanocellales archaeon]|nr:phage recombination protein Bet [Methanocellales archaeon]
MNDLVKYKWQDTELEISPDIVRRFISTSKNVTDQEIKDFTDLCIYQHLNPYIKEAYLVKYGTEKANIITSKDVFDKRAFRDPKYDGEEITTNYERGMNLMDLWVRTRIYHKGLSHPAADVTVYYSEYVGKKKDGTISFIWRTKPVTMTTKVSRAQAKRAANPEDLAGLYLTEEFDQQARPTEKDIREIDVTPKEEKSIRQVIQTEEGKILANKIEEVFPAEDNEITDDDLPQDEDIPDEEGEQEVWQDPDFKPASEKQLNFIYGVGKKKGIVHSHLITQEEIDRIGKSENMDIEKASKILAWWWGDKEKNIIGEQEKREKNEKLNPKRDKNDLERRGELMKEVLDLMEKNHIKPAERKKMYRKYQKDEIIKLAYEELEELKALLEHYV